MRVSLLDLTLISQETQASMCASSTDVVVIKKQIVLAYNLETAEEEQTLSSLII